MPCSWWLSSRPASGGCRRPPSDSAQTNWPTLASASGSYGGDEGRSTEPAGWSAFGLDRRGLGRVGAVWRIGLPLGAQMLLEVAAFALLTALFASMSEVDVAAHQIALQVIHFSFLPAVAIGEAASVMVGQAVGADEDRRVRPLARQALGLTGGYTGACALLMALGAAPIAAAFSDEPALQQATVRLLYIAAVFQIFDGANIVGRSVLRGTGDVTWPAMVNVGCAWLVTPPLALLLGYGLGMGVTGGWLGICAEIVLGAVLLWWRLERGRWRAAAERSRCSLEHEPAPSSQQPVVAM